MAQPRARGYDGSASPLVSVNSIGDGDHTMSSIRQRLTACTKGSVYSSVFTLLTSCVGAGTLSLPYAFSQGGLVLSSAVFFMVMMVAVLVGFMLFSAKRYCAEVYPQKEVWGYEDLAHAAFGAVGKIAVLTTLVLLLFLALIAYMIYARDQLNLVVQFIISRTGHIPDCSPLVNCALLMAIGFLPIFPITLLRDLTRMQITSTISILCICYVAVVATVKTSMAWVHLHSNDTIQNTIPPDWQDTVRHSLGPKGFTGLVTVISYCSLSFVCQFNLLPVQKELQNPTKRRLNIIVIASIVTAYVLYNIVIFMAYFNFFDSTREDFMLNYSRDDILVTTARAALFVTLMFGYPVILHPTRGALNRLLGLLYDLVVERISRRSDWVESSVDPGESKPLLPETNSRKSEHKKVPTWMWFCETLIMFGATFLPASFIPNVGYVWNFVGSIGGVLVLYIFPPAFYLRLRYLRYVSRAVRKNYTICSQYNCYAVYKEAVAVIVLILGVVLLFLTNYQSIHAVIHRVHQPSSLCFQTQCGHRT